MTEQTRNQHKNTMKDRPFGQSSLLQFGKIPEPQFGDEDTVCPICRMSESNHDTEECIEEYDC